MNRLADDRGSVTAFVAVVAIALVMVTGMVYDGGQVIAAQGRARSYAAKAARAGAQELDLTTFRGTGDTALDPVAAEQHARSYLANVGASGTVVVDGADITVTVTVTQPLLILPGEDRTITVSESATAIDQVNP